MLADVDRPISSERSTFEWNTILRRANPTRALAIYARSMLPSGSLPNKFTFTFLLKACLHPSAASCRPAVAHLHAHVTELGLHPDPFLRSALIAAYAACGRVSAARRVFNLFPPSLNDVVVHTALVSAYASSGMPDAARKAFDDIPDPNPVSWAALISAYTRSGRHAEAISTSLRMRGLASASPPTEAALVSVLTSTANLGAIAEGERAHRDVLRRGVDGLTPGLATALLSMYARCGRLESAVKVFDEMPDRDQPAWTTMITALAAHGRGEEALCLFEEMVCRGFYPDNVTYVAVLHACSHAGMVAEARRQFERMGRVHGVAPGLEHYGCMVDVLGRAGMVDEAVEMVQLMPMEPDEYVLKSLLSACCNYGMVEHGEWVAKKLMAMDAGHASAYVMLSNAYASLGRWEDSTRIRKMMRERGVPKSSGCSAVDPGNSNQ